MRLSGPLPIVCLCLSLSFADGAVADWDGSIEGGTVVRDGGNATRLSVTLVNDERPLTHALHADWLRYDDGNGYRVGYVPRYWVGVKPYLFAELGARVDRPFGIDAGYVGIAGAGYRVFDTRERGLGVELGLGARRTEFESGLEESEGLTLVRAAFHQVLAESLRLELDADVLAGERFDELRAEAGLAYRVPGGAVRLGYTVRRLRVDDGTTIEDDAPSLSFSYGF